MTTEIENKQYKRFKVLHQYYEDTNGGIKKMQDVRASAKKVGVTNGDFEDAYSFLIDKSFIEPVGQGYHSNLTGNGRDAVEDTVTNPTEKQPLWASYKEMGF